MNLNPSFSRSQAAKGYTLIELLIVIALMASLAALLFPLLSEARDKARSTTCLSNLRQIGLAMAAYAQDFDGYYPYGADPIDKQHNVWGTDEKTNKYLAEMPLLHILLKPYYKQAEIWHCPADTGVDTLKNHTDREGNPLRLDAHPSVFARYGTSYVWRTELAFRQKLFAGSAYRGSQEVGCAELTVVNDLTGEWHGGKEFRDWRINALMGDGHVTTQNIEQNAMSWALSLSPP